MEDPDALYWDMASADAGLVASWSSWGWGAASVVISHGIVVGLCLAPMLTKYGAPYAPTLRPRRELMLRRIAQHVHQQHRPTTKRRQQQQPPRRILYDLGSGDGRLVLAAAAQRDLLLDECIGLEINPFWHAVARMRHWRRYGRHNNDDDDDTPSIRFLCRDLWRYPLHDAHVVVLYAYPPMMVALGHKLRQELAPGSLVVSNQYPIPGWQPEKLLDNDDDDDIDKNDKEGVLVYRMPQKPPTEEPQGLHV